MKNLFALSVLGLLLTIGTKLKSQSGSSPSLAIELNEYNHDTSVD